MFSVLEEVELMRWRCWRRKRHNFLSKAQYICTRWAPCLGQWTLFSIVKAVKRLSSSPCFSRTETIVFIAIKEKEFSDCPCSSGQRTHRRCVAPHSKPDPRPPPGRVGLCARSNMKLRHLTSSRFSDPEGLAHGEKVAYNVYRCCQSITLK